MDRTLNAKKQKTARLSVMSNSFLIIIKLVVGFYSGAVSIISEAAHSGVDLIAALVAFYAVRKAGQPPDNNHDYGHGKIENLSGAIEAILIIIAALWIVVEAIQKISAAEQPEYLEYGIFVMLISIAVNYWVSEKLYSVAKETRSQALEADALHLRADIWTSAGVLVGLVVIKLTGFYWLDPVIAILVAGIVFRAGYKMTRKSFLELTDISLPDSEAEQIGEIVSTHKEVITFHRLRTRRSGSYRLIDMHVVLDKNMHLDKAHAVCDSIEIEIEESLGHCDVVIHLEPCNAHCQGEACQLLVNDVKDDKIQIKCTR